MSLVDLLGRIPDQNRPFLTFYDLDTGERVELSARTCANWVAKTSSFLVDEVDAEIGTRIRIGLPTHWLRPIWLLASWNVGAVVVDRAADIGVSGPDLVATEPIRLASALLPFAARFPTQPVGFVDLGAEIPGQPDAFVALDMPSDDDAALDLTDWQASHADVLADVEPDARRLISGPTDLVTEVRRLVAAATGGGSLVLVVGQDDPARRSDIAAQEQATAPT